MIYIGVVTERSKVFDLKSKAHCAGGSNPSHFIFFLVEGFLYAVLCFILGNSRDFFVVFVKRI